MVVTGIGHPAESAGLLPPLDQWTNPDLAASAIGTHQSATALQLWAAYNVIANDGRYVQPRLVDSVTSPDGTRTPVEGDAPRQVISARAAQAVSDMLQEVVRDGTESRLVTEEYRRKMHVYMPHTTARERSPANTMQRIISQ